MVDIDNLAEMKTLDPSGVLDSTALFPDQCLQAWTESTKLSFTNEYYKVKNIVVCGMGGSRFTPRTIKELYRDRITLPYEIVEDYSVPHYVNQDTLLIMSSYSGSTGEVLTAGKMGLKQGAKITAVVQGGKIGDWIKELGVPAYIFDPKYNPCGQPRIGSGYLLMGHAGLLKALGFLDLTDEEVNDSISFTRSIGKKYRVDVSMKDNQAKQLAQLLKDTHPFIITAEFLRGFANGFANQINETAKMISDYRYISELNHHLMEGLKRPDSLHRNGIFLFFESALYSDAIRKRFKITKEVVTKQSVKIHSVELSGFTKLSQVLEAFTLSGFTTFYMAMLYDTDPVAIPWVDYFKERLAQ